MLTFTTQQKSRKVVDKSEQKFEPRIRWLDLIAILYVHIGAVYGLYLLALSKSIKNLLWIFAVIYTSGFGITAGVHRLWSHRGFKAKWPLRVILMLLFTVTGQRDIYTWALDHRIHHKYSETDADPHNAKRGFLFSHVGWLVLTPHPDVVEKRVKVDMNDLEADPVVMWQRKYYYPLFAILTVAFPVLVPCYFWNESLWNSMWMHFNTRFCITLNIAFFVNSVAHMYGMRPYDKHISPTENLAVSIAALGEGWHNYHHVFPYDYRTGELGNYKLNPTTGFIDFFAKLGWAYDLKTVPPELIKRKKKRSGDGSVIWGWGDRDMPKDELKEFSSK
ncbi:UNVERIFIED_CONTAM: hypothetical protein PYX00_002836 [Menopon gallinae]|uniref:Fatty acid desaturase domain-containing protein n=1 Tax=Menopon gallinae TaxID=328185 RepID=A0AAW2HXR2_9NEOP